MTHQAEPFSDTTPGEAPVRGFLHPAQGDGSGLIILTHGAGGNARAPLLAALAERFAAIGMSALRCDLPFRQRRATGPPSPSDAQRDQDGEGGPVARRCRNGRSQRRADIPIAAKRSARAASNGARAFPPAPWVRMMSPEP